MTQFAGLAGLIGCSQPLTQVYDVLLLDLDGVVYIGADPVPGAAQALHAARSAGVAARFVTNNASRPAPVVAQHLRDLGVEAGDDEVVTSAQAAAGLLAARVHPGARILVVGGEGLYWALAQEGLTPVASMDDDPVAVVQGFSPDLGWRLLAEGARGVRAGLPWIATNTDLTVPTPYGPAPGNGTLVAAIAAATGSSPQVAGKPQPTLFLDAVRRSGAARPLVIGDRLDTDLEGARAAGIDGLIVLTGVSSGVDLLASVPAQRPHLIGLDLGALAQVHPCPEPVEGAWQCGDSLVRVGPQVPGSLEVVRAGTEALNLLRAACSASWAEMDARAGAVPDPAPVVAALTALDSTRPWSR
jgi:HAD superfamily hydrolase (TIGR01450 family)